MGAAPAPPRALRGSPAGTPRRSLALSQSHAGGASWPGARRSATGCHRRQGASPSGEQVTGCPPPAFLSLRSNGSHWLLTPAVRKDSSRSVTAQFQGRKLGWWRRRHRPGVPREPEWPGFHHPGRVSGDPFAQRSACSRLSGRTWGALRCPTDRGALSAPWQPRGPHALQGLGSLWHSEASSVTSEDTGTLATSPEVNSQTSTGDSPRSPSSRPSASRMPPLRDRSNRAFFPKASLPFEVDI